jgi:hypothetical protein
MKYKILGWVGIVWGSLIIVNGIIRLISVADLGGGAYGAGQLVGFVLGALFIYAGTSALRRKPDSDKG